MLYIDDDNKTIQMAKTKEVEYTYLVLGLKNIITNAEVFWSVTDTSTNPYIYKIKLTNTQYNALEWGEYRFAVIADNVTVESGLLRKVRHFPEPTVYNYNPVNTVYNETIDEI